MRASEYIERLSQLINEHGDLPVYDSDDSEAWAPEFNDDDEPCFILP